MVTVRSAKWTVAHSCRSSSAVSSWSVPWQTDCCRSAALTHRAGANQHKLLPLDWTAEQKVKRVVDSNASYFRQLFGFGRHGEAAARQSALLLRSCRASLLQKRTAEGKKTSLINAFTLFLWFYDINLHNYLRVSTIRQRKVCQEFWNQEKL